MTEKIFIAAHRETFRPSHNVGTSYIRRCDEKFETDFPCEIFCMNGDSGNCTVSVEMRHVFTRRDAIHRVSTIISDKQ
jgi:hypothetical protein